MNITAFIQARTGSTRLPGKVLLPLEGKPVIEHVVNRVRKSRLVTETIVVTTILPEDLKLVKFCSSNGIRVFCGSENDVLDRFFQAAKLIRPDHIVRITADCPMIDPAMIDRVIEKHLANKNDYTNNITSETFPDGEDVEVFTFDALRSAWEQASLPSDKEHVTLFIRNHSGQFRLSELKSETVLGDKRWTLDNKEDYLLIKKIFRALYKKNRSFGIDAILKFLAKNPGVENLNRHIARNEGLMKSLREDKMKGHKPGR